MWTFPQLAIFEALNHKTVETLRHKPTLDFVDWAPANIKNPDGTAFAFRETQIQPARDLFNPTLPHICIRAFSGAGKTYLIAAAIGYAIEQLRHQIGVMFPNQDIAEDWVNEELEKLFDSSPCIAQLALVTDLKRFKRWFIGATLTALGANSTGRMRRFQGDTMYADEIDAIEQNAKDEGDKLANFYKRGRGREVQHKWATSYPSLKGVSKIDALYELSDQCKWHVPCYHCEKTYVSHTRQMLWTPGQPETARLICPDCEYPHTDEQRLVTAKAGQYLNKKKEPPQDGVNRGFHLGCMAQVAPHNSAYSGYLHEVAAERESILKSDNPEKSRRVFVNTMDAESFAESVEDKPEADTLYTRREEWNPTESLPAGVLMLTMGVDVQKDRLEAIIVGWGLNNECWLIAYRVITGSPLKEETWNKLDKLRTTKWDHPVAANPMLPVCTFVDSGKWSNTIYEYTRQRIRAGVFSCKGAKMLDRPLMDGKATKTGRPVTMLYNVGTHEAKDLIYQRLELSPPKKKGSPYPQGYIHVPAIEDFGEAAGGDATGFFEMLLAEDSMLKRSTRTGEFLRFFDCPKGKRNEALDTFVYAMAAERVMRPEYETIAEGLAG